MRTLQDYISIYREVAQNLNIGGDMVEVLVQLLANASYINEVENISYVQEASLERATLENSKIQHCMNDMYSVFRGNCPRVILRFKATKYFAFNPYEKIVSSNNFNVYYLGYYKEGANTIESEKRIPVEEDFIYSKSSIAPGTEAIIIGFLTNEVIQDTWTVDDNNKYYVESSGTDLSNDMTLEINGVDWTKNITRTFSDHILSSKVFDLTTTDYGSRLYFATLGDNETNSVTTGTTISAQYFKFTTLSAYNESELKKINIKGTELLSFDSDFLDKRGYSEISKGIIVLNEIRRDDTKTIHYKANRDRYVNSIIRSNSDLGTMLEEMFPEKLRSGGTNCIFQNDGLDEFVIIYYVPKEESNLLTRAEAGDFLDLRLPYFLINNKNNVKISKGHRFTARFNLGITLSGFDTQDLDKEIESILRDYEYKFEVNLDTLKNEIYTRIGKLSKISSIDKFEVEYLNDKNEVCSLDNVDLGTVYFVTSLNIYTTIKS